jgi:hypothetical protein
MFLPPELLQCVAEFISVEVLVYLFPQKGFKTLDDNPEKYNYQWACTIPESRIRNRVLLYFLRSTRVPDSPLLVDHCSEKNNIYLLNRTFALFQTQSVPRWTCWYSHRSVDLASANGWDNVLSWWIDTCRQFGISFRYSHIALDRASINGQLNVLEWWKTNTTPLRLLYTKDAMDFAHSSQVLDWWLKMHLDEGIELRYSSRSIDHATHIRILEWWLAVYRSYGIRLKYKVTSIHNASAQGNVQILDWWFNRTPLTIVPLKYSEVAVDLASANGHLHVLNWWLTQWEERNCQMRYSSNAIDLASENGHLNILEWWFARSQEGRVLFKRTVQAINQASRNGHLHILDWWLLLYTRFKIPFLYDSWAIEWALHDRRTMHWWAQTCSKYSFSMDPIEWNRYRQL